MSVKTYLAGILLLNLPGLTWGEPIHIVDDLKEFSWPKTPSWKPGTAMGAVRAIPEFSTYANIRCWAVSPDQSKIAAVVESGKRHRVVEWGAGKFREFALFDDVRSDLLFTYDAESEHVHYITKNGLGETFWLIDDRAVRFDLGDWASVSIGHHGHLLGSRATDALGRAAGPSKFVLEKTPEFDIVHDLDAPPMVFRSDKQPSSNNPVHEYFPSRWPEVGPNNSLLLVTSKRIEVDGKQVYTYSRSGGALVSIRFSADQHHYIVFSNRHPGDLILNGAPLAGVQGAITYAAVSDTGKVAYAFTNRDAKGKVTGGVTIVGGASWPAAYRIIDLTISPDGQHIGYTYVNGDKRTLLVDGKPVELTGQPQPFGNAAIQFSPDSRSWMAMFEGNGRREVVVNGIPGPVTGRKFDGYPIWSPDSQHIVYSLDSEGHGPSLVLVDGFPLDVARDSRGSTRIQGFAPSSEHIIGFGPFLSLDGKVIPMKWDVAGMESNAGVPDFGKPVWSDSYHFHYLGVTQEGVAFQATVEIAR